MKRLLVLLEKRAQLREEIERAYSQSKALDDYTICGGLFTTQHGSQIVDDTLVTPGSTKWIRHNVDRLDGLAAILKKYSVSQSDFCLQKINLEELIHQVALSQLLDDAEILGQTLLHCLNCKLSLESDPEAVKLIDDFMERIMT